MHLQVPLHWVANPPIGSSSWWTMNTELDDVWGFFWDLLCTNLDAIGRIIYCAAQYSAVEDIKHVFCCVHLLLLQSLFELGLYLVQDQRLLAKQPYWYIMKRSTDGSKHVDTVGGIEYLIDDYSFWLAPFLDGLDSCVLTELRYLYDDDDLIRSIFTIVVVKNRENYLYAHHNRQY